MIRFIRFYDLKLCSWMSSSVWNISAQFRTIKTQQRLNCLSVGRTPKVVQFSRALNESLAGEWRIEFRPCRFTQLSAVNCHLSRQKCRLYVCGSRLYIEQHGTIAFWHVSVALPFTSLSPTHTLSLSLTKSCVSIEACEKVSASALCKINAMFVCVYVCMTIPDFPGKVGCTHYVCHAPASINQSKLSNAYKLYASALHCPADAAVGVGVEMLPACLPGPGLGTQPDRTITRHVLHKCNMHTTYTWTRGRVQDRQGKLSARERAWAHWIGSGFGIGLQVQLTTCRRQARKVCECIYILYMCVYVCMYVSVWVCVCERLLELVECRLSRRRWEDVGKAIAVVVPSLSPVWSYVNGQWLLGY